MYMLNLCEVLRNIEKLDSEEIVQMINKGAITLAKRGEQYKVVRTESDVAETIEHAGVKLRNVDRKCKTDDRVMFSGLPSCNTVNSKLYEVIENDKYRDEEGNLRSVYGWPHCLDPELYEVVSTVGVYKKKPKTVIAFELVREQESLAHMIDIVALKEVAEILDDVLHREAPFRMLSKNGEIDVASSREQFLEHYVEYAVEAIKGLLYESGEGD